MDRLKARLQRIGRDPKITAKAAGLRYCGCGEKGIFRKRKGTAFYYVDESGQKINSPEILDRISSLVLPPAWENVWICPYENGHLQAVGTDAKGRRQYRYHPAWNQLRNQSKFYRLRDFSKALPSIRRQVNRDIRKKGMPAEKLKALLVELLEQTNIRIGNDSYSKLYGSFGLTTLRDKHVKNLKSGKLYFEFIGKKGVAHKIALNSPRLVRLVRRCKEIPGQELFQWIADDGSRHHIKSEDINGYIKELSGADFTAKDFRCWFGSVLAMEGFRQLPPAESEKEKKRQVLSVIDQVASILGNTRTVCRKYYIHPTVISAHEQNRISKYTVSPSGARKGLTPQETALVKLLENETIASAS